MAEANDTGKGAENKGTGAPVTPGSVAGGSDKSTGDKLYAGKYKTLEEAVEKGYKGLEDGFHQTRQEVAEVKESLQQMLGVLENAFASGGSGGQGAGGGENAQGGGGSPGQYTAADFISDPEKILSARDDKLYNKFAGLLTDTVSNLLDAQEYRSTNADLAGHERLVRSFLDETDTKKSLKERLDAAGKKTRDYLTHLRGSNAQGDGQGDRGAGGNTHVEDVSAMGYAPAHYARAGEGPDAGTFEVLTPKKRLENLNEFIKDRLVSRMKMS